MAEKLTKEQEFAGALEAWFIGSKATHEENLGRIETYFGLRGEEVYDGARFETYGRRDEDVDRIVPADLVAVTMLSMEIRRKSKYGIKTSHALAIEDRAEEISALLREIPASKEIHTLNESERARLLESGDDSVGQELWNLLHRDIGMYPVATYKLIARKRPHLFPIADSRTRTILGNPKNWWTSWHDALRTKPDIVAELKKLRSEAATKAPIIRTVSLLRIGDIALWMDPLETGE